MISSHYQQQDSPRDQKQQDSTLDQELSAFIHESKYLFKENPGSFCSNDSQQVDERLEKSNTDYLKTRFSSLETDIFEGIVGELKFELRDFSEKDLEILKEYKKKIEKIEGMKSNDEEKVTDKNEESTQKKGAKKNAPIFNTQQTPKKLHFKLQMFAKLENLPLLFSAETQKNNNEKDDSSKKKDDSSKKK